MSSVDMRPWYELQMEASAGAQDMDLGQSIGFLTLQQMPALPDFDMLLPRGSNPTAEPKVQAAPARQGMRKPAAVQERAQARVSIRALGRKSLSLTRVGKLQSWHRSVSGIATSELSLLLCLQAQHPMEV